MELSKVNKYIMNFKQKVKEKDEENLKYNKHNEKNITFRTHIDNIVKSSLKKTHNRNKSMPVLKQLNLQKHKVNICLIVTFLARTRN